MDENKEENEPTLERDFIETTTLHGIVRIGDRRKFTIVRILWFLAFVACMAACVWTIYIRVGDFFNYEVNTKVSRVYTSPLEFPAVTICNFNRYRASQVTEQDRTYLEFALYADPYDYDSFNDNNKFDRANFDYNAYFGNPNYTFDYTEFTKRAGFVLDDSTLHECKWRGRNCSAANFTHVFTSYGNCYTFNGGQDQNDKTVAILEEDQPGSEHGLKVIMSISQDEYTESISGNIQAGLKVLVHDQADPPLMDALGSGIPPGTYAFMAIRRQKYSNLGPPWGACDKSRTLNYYDEYTLSGCFIECRLIRILDECNCRPVSYPGDAEVCSPQETSSCVKDVLRRFKKGSLGKCNCPVPCQYTQYSTSLSYGHLPNDNVAASLSNELNLTVDYIRNNLLVLDVFYEELNFESFKENKALTLAGLLSDIGGNLGLFLGGSILTFAEIIEYIFMKCIRPCRPRSEEKQESKPQPTSSPNNPASRLSGAPSTVVYNRSRPGYDYPGYGRPSGVTLMGSGWANRRPDSGHHDMQIGRY